MNLTISIVVHNNRAMTEKCLESIFKYTPTPYTLIVTDNASTDGTLDFLQDLAGMKIIRNEKNLGFSLPHREAFATCETPFFCVLNNDLEVVEGWTEAMLAEFEKDALVAQVGIKRSCSALDENGRGVPTSGDPEYAEGSCMIVRTEVVRHLEGGLFDPIYKFAYYEDSDLSLRLKKAGYKISVADLPIIHVGAATARIVKGVDLEGYQIRNKHIFLGRWDSYLKSRISHRVTKDRIVVRRAGARGDVIMTTPIVRALRKTYPKSRIIVSTVCPEVYSQNPDVNEVTLQGTPLRESDLTYNLDMAYEKRPMVHPIQAYADVCGITVEDWTPALYPTDVARTVALQRLPDGPKYALIHPGPTPGWVGRQLAPAKFVSIAQELHKRGYKTVTVGSQDAPQIKTDLDFRNIPFPHFVALMERASIFVGLDSMPFWVAQACKTPSAVIFGCVDPSLRLIPGGPAIGVTSSQVACIGCHNWLPGQRTVTSACIRGKDRCMSELTPDEVMVAVDQLIEARREA